MRIVRWIAAATLLGSVAGGQEQAAPPAQELSGPEKKLKELEERFNAKRGEVIAAYRKAASEEEKKRILAGLPGKDFVPDFRALAEEAAGTDTAVKCWMWVMNLQSDDRDASWEVVEILVERYMQSPGLEGLASQLRYGMSEYGEARVVEVLRALTEESPHPVVQASAFFSLGAGLLETGKEANLAEGRRCLETVIGKYASVTSGERSYRTQAESFLFELDRLQIGMAAPDFETVDENGAKWKLSDYEGKVVVVDFWGNW